MFSDSLKMLGWKVLIIGMGAFTAVILARWLGPDLRGELAILLLTLSLATLVFQLGIPEAAIYLLGSNDHGKGPAEIAIIAIGLVLAVLFMIFCTAVILLISTNKQELYLLLGLTGGVSISLTFTRHIFLAKKFFHYYSFTVSIETLAYLAGITTINATGDLTVFNAVLAYSCSLVAALVVSISLITIDFQYDRKSPFEISKTLRVCLDKGKHFLLTGLGGFGAQRLNYFLIEYFTGVRSVGLFTAAFMLPSFISMIPQQVATVAYSHVAAGGDQKSPLRVVKPIIQSLFLGIITAVLIIMQVSDRLVFLIFGPEFAGIGDSMVILCLATGLGGLASICVNALAGFGRPQAGTYMTIISIPCLLFAGAILIPVLGILGAAIAMLITSIVSLTFVVILISRASDESMFSLFTLN